MTDITLDRLVAWLDRYAALVHDQHAELSELDSAIGDGDHGTNMDRGMAAVVGAVAEPGRPDTVAALFKQVGMALVRSVGGASGPLYGTFFLRFAGSGDAKELTLAELAEAFHRGLTGVETRGKAAVGDATMLDALTPAVSALADAVAAGRPLAAALGEAASAAEAGRYATIPMVAKKGRASYLGERSIGHQDPGATSAALLVRAAAETLAG